MGGLILDSHDQDQLRISGDQVVSFPMATTLITGAAGFIGSHLCRYLLENEGTDCVVALDALTYAGSEANIADLVDPRFVFVKGSIGDRDLVRNLFLDHEIDRVVNLAAETHVDRSIVDPVSFVRTNVEGTLVLVQEAITAWSGRDDVLFYHVSTDEVFGALGPTGAFVESSPYSPRSPYSASKAAADHLVRAAGETYGLRYIISHAANNYGPFQFPEKLIPLTINKVLRGERVPIYGKGENIRDWLYVEDHCRGIAAVLANGQVGESYCIGGDQEFTNLELVGMLLDELDRARSVDVGTSRGLISFVTDRPGHDFRYAMDSSKAMNLGWSPSVKIEEGLCKTVAWYLNNECWCERALAQL